MTGSEFAETLRQAAELLSTLADIVEKRCRQRFLRYRKQGAWDRLVRRGAPARANPLGILDQKRFQPHYVWKMGTPAEPSSGWEATPRGQGLPHSVGVADHNERTR
jgi:hypothetical protein